MAAELLVPEVTQVEVDLVRRRTLGGPGDNVVSGQIAIGRSEAVRLCPDSLGVDPALAQRLQRDEETHHYYLVLLSCTFRLGSAPIVSAVLSVDLQQAEIVGVPRSVVWSMDPLRLATPVNRRRSVSIGPDIKIVPEILEVTGSAERTTEYTSEIWHLIAQGEGESQVEWVFTATPAVELIGMHHLSLIARTSTRVICRADLAMAAKRKEKRFGIVQYRADIHAAARTIRLSGS